MNIFCSDRRFYDVTHYICVKLGYQLYLGWVIAATTIQTLMVLHQYPDNDADKPTQKHFQNQAMLIITCIGFLGSWFAWHVRRPAVSGPLAWALLGIAVHHSDAWRIVFAAGIWSLVVGTSTSIFWFINAVKMQWEDLFHHDQSNDEHGPLLG